VAHMELVRRYFDGLREGRTVDALDVFATDAILRDERGVEHRGIRAIAASFTRLRRPVRIDLLDLRGDEGRVTAIVETRGSGPPVRSRQVFEVRDGRVRSLVREPVRMTRAARKQAVPSRWPTPGT
jgi:hypothetical protein